VLAIKESDNDNKTTAVIGKETVDKMSLDSRLILSTVSL